MYLLLYPVPENAGPFRRMPTPNGRTHAMQLTAANLSRLDRLTKSDRVSLLMEESSKLIDKGEDASHLLSRLQAEVEASSSARPRTGQSAMQGPRPGTATTEYSIAGSLGQHISESMLSAKMEREQRQQQKRPPSTAASQSTRSVRPPTAKELMASSAPLAEELEVQLRERLSTASSRRPVTGQSQASRPATGIDASRATNILECKPVLDPYELVSDEMKEKFRKEYRAMQEERRQMAEAEARQRALEEQAAASESESERPPPTPQPRAAPLADVGNADALKRQQQLSLMQLAKRQPNRSGGANESVNIHSANDSVSLSLLQTGSYSILTERPKQGRKHVASRAAASTIGSLLSGTDE